MELRKIYALFMQMSYDEFRHFTDPKNDTCQLLQAHFVAMQLIMTPITKAEWAGRQTRVATKPDGRSARWLENLHQTVPLHMLEYYKWTMWIERAVVEGDICYGIDASPDYSESE